MVRCSRPKKRKKEKLTHMPTRKVVIEDLEFCRPGPFRVESSALLNTCIDTYTSPLVQACSILLSFRTEGEQAYYWASLSHSVLNRPACYPTLKPGLDRSLPYHVVRLYLHISAHLLARRAYQTISLFLNRSPRISNSDSDQALSQMARGHFPCLGTVYLIYVLISAIPSAARLAERLPQHLDERSGSSGGWPFAAEACPSGTNQCGNTNMCCPSSTQCHHASSWVCCPDCE